MNPSKTHEKLHRVIYDVCLFIFFGLSFYLYYQQLGYGITKRFESDTYAHVMFAVEDGFFYSFTSYFYYALSLLPLYRIWISLFLAFATIGSVKLTERLFRILFFANPVSDSVIYGLAFLSNFISAFYIPFVNKQHYIGYQCANMWHNSTYLFMRFFALLSLLFFFRLWENETEKMNRKVAVLFSLSLCIATGIKASFLLVFAPTVFVILIMYLIATKNFKRALGVVLTALPSFLVIVWQSIVLFGEETSNSTILAPFRELSARGEHVKVTLVLSILYPLVVFALHAKAAYKNKYYMISLLMTVVGFLQAFLFAETGNRAGDGNFLWGYSIALFFWFIMTAYLSVSEYKKEKKAGFLIFESIIGGWQVISGIWYFVLLLTGVTYFI